MKQFFRFLLIACFLVIMPTFAEERADDQSIDDTIALHVYNDVDLISMNQYDYPQPGVMIKSVYPHLKSDSNNPAILHFNQLILQKTKNIISSFMQEVKKNQAIQKRLPNKLRKNELNIDFDTSSFKLKNDQIISIRFSSQSYLAGMAHPMHRHDVLNYNLTNGKQIELKDLFRKNIDYLTLFSTYTRQVLDKRFSNKEMVENGTMPTADHFKNWNIKSTGILITFEEAQVAPYVNGAQVVLIPYQIFKEKLSARYSIDHCAHHHKSCLRESLLTGGFIDSMGA